jgi:hypothetical protein
VDLHAPDLLALLDPRHLEEHVRADPPLERRVEVGGEVGGEDDHAVERLQLAQEDAHHRVRLALVRVAAADRPPRGDRVRLVEEEHCVLLARQAEDGGDVLRRLPDPHRLELGVTHDEQLLA